MAKPSKSAFWRKVSVVSWWIMLAGYVMFLGCTAQEVKKVADTTQQAAQAAGSLLPPPWGVIAGIIASAAGVVSTMAAAKSKGTSLAQGQTPHPIADFVSSHSWIMPSLSAIVGFANSMGWIHVSPAELGTLIAGFSVATGVQVVADGHAENQAPSAPASTGTAPTSTTTASTPTKPPGTP